MFNVTTFKNKLSTRWLGQSLLFFEELNSTNTYVKQLPVEEISHGLLCLTNYQTHGRGQYEKNWESQPGKNLTFTLTFLPAKADRFHILTLACAKCVTEAIEEVTGIETFIKWPNDVYIKGKKIGGLLTETTFSGNKIDRLLIGIGLNINQDYFSENLEAKATSLRMVSGKDYSRESFLADVLSRAEYEYTKWHKKDVSQLKEINKKILGYGQWVKLQVDGKVREEPAKLLGVNEQGQLAVLNEEGEIKTFSYEQIRIVGH